MDTGGEDGIGGQSVNFYARVEREER